MIKAGLLGAVAGLIYVMSLTLVSPFCPLCFTPLLGLGVGYLAGQFDRPLKVEASLSKGGMAGGITGLSALVGQMLAAVVNGVLVTNWEQVPAFIQEMNLGGLPEANEYWQVTLMANAFCSVLNLMIIAGLGAAGGLIWFQRQHKNSLSAVAP